MSACRPSQLCDLAHPPGFLDAARWESVVNSACDKLLNPLGLRSLSPDHPDFKPTYYGDLRNRDAAYHQGTGVGLADRPLPRCLAEGPPRRPGRRAPLPRWLHSPPRRGVHWLDQRSLRRHCALHTAGLHRPGVKRRRGPAVPGHDLRAWRTLASDPVDRSWHLSGQIQLPGPRSRVGCRSPHSRRRELAQRLRCSSCRISPRRSSVGPRKRSLSRTPVTFG